MARKLLATIIVELPSDPFAAAGVYAALQPAWAALLEALKTGGAPYDIKFQELEQRAPRKRAPRKPKLVSPLVTPPGEAA
jgi:hypothetical protein